jgi:hypothetical protein
MAIDYDLWLMSGPGGPYDDDGPERVRSLSCADYAAFPAFFSSDTQ